MARCLQFLAILMTLTALALTDAQRSFQKCDCSPSKRGFNNNVLDFLVKKRDKTVEESTEAAGKGFSESQVENLQRTKAAVDFQACIDNYSKEQCVNADAALRRGSCYPNCMVYCLWNEASWMNVNTRGEDAESCDTIPKYRSSDVDIEAKKPQQKSAVRPSNSPVPDPVSGEDAAKGADNGNGGGSDADGGSGADPEESPDAASNADTANEGCVAVEHLHGYALQHTENLTKKVLCSADGFCATPNHALIVDGTWTSMKTLCASKWSCVASQKLVNNLNLFVNRRAVYKDVVITPYDARFPKCGVFLVQALEKMFLQHPIFTAVTILSVVLARKSMMN